MNKRTLTVALVVAAAMLLGSSASAHERKIVVEGFEGHRNTMGFHLVGGGLTLSDDTLDQDGVARLGGVTFGFTWDLVDWGGLELMAGSYGRLSDGGLVDEQRGMASLAWRWYFARHHHHRFFAVTGLTSLSTQTEIGDTTHDYEEGGLLLGIGSEWMVSRNFVVTSDARMMFLSSSEPDDEWSGDRAGTSPDGRYPDRWYEIPEERVGFAFNVGIGYRF